MRFDIQKEIGIDQGSRCGGDKDRGVKSQNCRLSEYENYVYKREANRNDGVIPLGLFSFIEQKPVGYVHNGENDVEAKAADAPIELRIATGRACEHNVEHKECEQNTEHTDKLQHGCRGDVAVFLLSCGLYQSGKHYADAKEIADVGEMNVKIPAQIGNVIEYSEARNSADESERAIYGLVDQLCGSVFDHNKLLYILFFLFISRFVFSASGCLFSLG